MPQKPKNYSLANKIKLYDKLLGAHPEIERKGKTMPYTSVNGHMFSFLSKEGEMGLRLPDAEREKFLKEHNTKLMEQYGRTMKEYVRVPNNLLEDTEGLKSYLDKSYRYTASLKPKPAKK